MFETQYTASRVDMNVVGLALNLGNRGPVLALPALDDLLSEALDESFPASDPISSLKFD
jgi:hypothetical protein